MAEKKDGGPRCPTCKHLWAHAWWCQWVKRWSADALLSQRDNTKPETLSVELLDYIRANRLSADEDVNPIIAHLIARARDFDQAKFGAHNLVFAITQWLKQEGKMLVPSPSSSMEGLDVGGGCYLTRRQSTTSASSMNRQSTPGTKSRSGQGNIILIAPKLEPRGPQKRCSASSRIVKN